MTTKISVRFEMCQDCGNHGEIILSGDRRLNVSSKTFGYILAKKLWEKGDISLKQSVTLGDEIHNSALYYSEEEYADSIINAHTREAINQKEIDAIREALRGPRAREVYGVS
jgi:hypothetical protein